MRDAFEWLAIPFYLLIDLFSRNSALMYFILIDSYRKIKNKCFIHDPGFHDWVWFKDNFAHNDNLLFSLHNRVNIDSEKNS